MHKSQKLIWKTYLKAIENSVGTKMFKNFYIEQDDEVVDAMNDGELSCAFFVSGLLVVFGLIKRIHGTVKVTAEDLEESGWKKVEHPEPGDVIIWSPEEFERHDHIGFYLGKEAAVSNSQYIRSPILHNWRFDGRRKIKAIYSRAHS